MLLQSYLMLLLFAWWFNCWPRPWLCWNEIVEHGCTYVYLDYCGGRMVEVGNVIVIDIEVFWMRCKISHHRKYKGNSGEFF